MTTLTIANDFTVNRIGLGTNRIVNDHLSRTILLAAVRHGINFIDTAQAYSNTQSEATIGETLAPYRGITVATKGGMGAPDFHIDASPNSLKKSLEGSLKRLKLSQIPLYILHRVDPHVRYEQTLEFLQSAQGTGKVKHLGLSEVTVEQIKKAQDYFEVVAVENEYNLVERKHEEVLKYCESENIAFLPWFPLHIGNLEEKILPLAKKYDATVNQIALAWLLHKSPVTLPIPGTRSIHHLRENIAAADIKLDEDDMNLLEDINSNR